jgi:pyrroloquinoline quinone (PQQ) biosynthesis protein C
MVLAPLADASRNLVQHPRIRELYPDFLFMSHSIIRASVPLMETARDRAVVLSADDPVAAPLAAYLEEHIPEELHHDEWLLDDFAAIGVARDAVLTRVPSPTVAELVGAQYYWILHYHPVAVLGYISLLEGYPPSPEMIEKLRERTGYPDEAFRTLRLHGELDPGHRQELDETLDRLQLTREQSAVVGLSAMASVQLYTQALDEVIGRA